MNEKKELGYWCKWENLEKEIKNLIIDGQFPTSKLLKTKLGKGVNRAISRFGGIKEIAKRMGYTPSYFYVATDGHYLQSIKELIFDEVLHSLQISHEVNDFVHKDYNYRFDFKINNLYFEIWGMSDINYGLGVEYNKKRKIKEELYKTLNLSLVSIENQVFNTTLKETENRIKNILIENGINISGDASYDISNVVNKVRTWNEKRIVEEFDRIKKEIGHFPGNGELRKLKNGVALCHAAERLGGFHYYANIFGENKKRKYWSEDKLINELKIIIEKLSKFPTETDLISLNKKNLVSAISKHGGFKYFKSIIH